MNPLWHLGTSTQADDTSETNITFNNLPDEIGGKPISVLALLIELDVSFNSAGGGAGVTGREMFNALTDITVVAEGETIVDGLNGRDCRVLEHQMLGKEPVLPADLAAAGGAAANRQLRIIVPFTDFNGPRRTKGRLKDYGVPGEVFKKTGSISFVWGGDGDFGNANDTITGGTAQVHAIVSLLSEGEVPQWFKIRVRDFNGSNNFTVPAGRYRYLTVFPGGGVAAEAELAAGEITQVSCKVNGSPIHENTRARTMVDQFNRDAQMDPTDRIVAPDDAALGVSTYFPVMWPAQDDALAAVPYGKVFLECTGSRTNFRVITVDVKEMSDKKRKRYLKLMGYSGNAVEKLNPALKVPKTSRPMLGGHLKMSPRKRALLPQIWHGLVRLARGREE